MSIEYGRMEAVFREEVGIDEAEGLVQWLQRTPAGRVDLSTCSHMHLADLQVLMTANVPVVARPDAPVWRMWLDSALPPRIGGK